MAINPYGSDVLRSINRIIQSEQERDRSEVKEALSFMQFAMQKRQTEVKEFGQRMEVLSNANKQLQANVASNFLVNSGLSSLVNLIPTGLEDFSDAQDAIGDVTKQLKKKDYGKFSKENANLIASTLWEYKQTNDPSSIVNLANSIGQMTKRKPTSGEVNLLKSLNKISNVSALSEVIRQAEQSTKNNSAILKEQFEFAKGDTKIQSGFGMLSEDVQDEFLKTKQKELEPDISSIADLIEKETENPSDQIEEEISGEKIFKEGYESKSAEELIEQTNDFLSKEEQSSQFDKIKTLTNKQIQLQNSLNELVNQRDDIIEDFEETKEKREIALKRIKYFSKVKDEKKRLEASNEYDKLNSLIENRNSNISREKNAFDRVSFFGERAADKGSNVYSQIEGTTSEKIVRIKQSIRELERQRNLLAQ